MSDIDPLSLLKKHPVYAITDPLAEFMGVEKDLVQFIEFLSLVAGRMVMPVNIDIQTNQVAVDLHLANKVMDLRRGHVARVDTHREFRALERAEFYLKGAKLLHYSDEPVGALRPLAVVLIRGTHRLLQRETSEYTARLTGGDFSLPSIWRISDLVSGLPPVASSLRVQAGQANRMLDDFGHALQPTGYCGWNMNWRI